MSKIDLHNYVVIPTSIVSSIIAILTIIIARYIISHFQKSNVKKDKVIMTMNATANPSGSKSGTNSKKQQSNSDKTEYVINYFKISSIVLVVSNGSCSLFNAIYCIYLVFDPYEDDNMFYTSHYSHFLRIISTICWYIGTIAVIWFFNGRLFYAFQGSIFRVSITQFRAINALVTILGIVSLVTAYCAVYLERLIVAEIAFNSFRIAYQIITFLLLFLFSKRLLLLTVLDRSDAKTNKANAATGVKMQSEISMSEMHVHSYTNNENNTSEHRCEFLHVTAKNAVLVTVTSTSVAMVTFFWFSFRFLFLPQTRLTLLIPMNMASIDALVNSVCCIMLFKFGKPLNDKICRCCNQCFINICVIFANKYVLKLIK